MRLKSIVLAGVVLIGSAAFAQGSGSTTNSSDFKVTRTLEGKIAQVKVEDSVIVIEDQKGETHTFNFSNQTEVASSKGEKKSKSFKISSLKPGEKVKVVFRASDSHAVKLKLLD